MQDYPDQMEKIQSFLRTRLTDRSDPKQVKKAVDALLRRGHSYGSIKQALNGLSFETEDFPEE